MWMQNLGVSLTVIEKDTYSIVTDKIPEGKTFCSLCSRLRRAILYDFAHANGFTKMAMGHHRDDVVNTTLLNLFYSGKLASMPPKLTSDDGRNTIIRPLCYVSESDLEQLAKDWDFPVIPCNLCGSQDGLKRKRMKKLVQELEKEIPHISSTIQAALANVNPSHLMDAKIWDFDNNKAP
jgi:tRNA 2-thiocytidine biosynthesis protein TtcA